MTPITDQKILRGELTPLPERIKALPVFRGYPTPWFCAMVNGEPEFRAADGRKWELAVKTRRCWICGAKLGHFLGFCLGPMCCISKTTAEPACHRECAAWAIRNCPFLARKHMVRRENDLPEGIESPPGEMLRRNPGVTALWMTHSFATFPDQNRRSLIQVGDPLEVLWLQRRPHGHPPGDRR